MTLIRRLKYPLGVLLFFKSYYLQAEAYPLSDCDKYQYPGPLNPSFESGVLDGWTVVSGTAFGQGSIVGETDSRSCCGDFNQVGNYSVWGYGNDGDPAIGVLQSSSFQASSVTSFLVGGGWDPVNLYIGLVRDSDNALLLNQTGMDDEAYIRIIWDTSAWVGQNVHIVAYDNSTSNSWGHINIDDIRVGCAALGDGNLTFNILGQANQPADGSLPDAQLYSVDPFRPQYHYTPYQGWTNDPCGLSQLNGTHHLFNQFNPDSPFGAHISWSHAISSDAVHWRRQPVALTPPYIDINSSDNSGRWTGSAVNDNGTLRLLFTDFTDTNFHPGAESEVVSTADSSDGITFQLYTGNPVVAAPPPDSPSGFRDPKVFLDATDNTWKMVLGGGDSTSGKIFLYSTSDMISWTYIGVLIEGDGTTGTMWECPNFFPIGDKWALFYGGNGQGWWHIGSYNGTNFVSEATGLLDIGSIYAAQWYVDESGRNLLMAWIYNFGTYKYPSRVNGYVGATTATRELFLRDDGGLGSRLITEIDSLVTGNPVSFGPQTVQDSLAIGHSSTGRLQLSVNLNTTTASSFSLNFLSSSAEKTVLTYTVANKTLTIDTSEAGYGPGGLVNAVITIPGNNILGLDILLDRTILEIFASDGTAITQRIYPRYFESTGITMVVDDGAVAITNITLSQYGSSWN
ncbi:glycosyl hydrolase [Talaromyces proteolyticus]|uniref:beta-fructofuranosidase n=1 Tax=Talaromyces proteolyticus TaxID=1131652 RepID=A0AAD4L193_9EURO|nr:glycosyl hydrolase [Talaromyces proteolyticus]KAH8705707.1 glycosyl hydrolase [Talaromyces proteolyticus]